MLDTIKIGTQPIAWSNDDFFDLGAETSLETCLAEMKEAGYVGAELGHKFPKDAAVLRPILSSYGLSLISGWHSTYLLSQDFNTEKENFIKHLDFLFQMGSPVVIVAECSFRIYHLSNSPNNALDISDQRPQLLETQWQRLADGLNALGKLALEKGMKLVYHQHMGTVIQSESELDQLMERTFKEFVYCLADTGHMAFAGMDPIAMIKKHLGRIAHVHLKDVRAEVVAKAKEQHWSFETSVRGGVFTVPGDGSLDFQTIMNLILNANYKGWWVVEAEQDPKLANPFVYAKKARETIDRYLNHGESQLSRMLKDFGTEFWNDSCDAQELAQAIAHGAIGATSNPVIVANAFENDKPFWNQVLKEILQKNPQVTEDEIAWMLVGEMAKKAAHLLEPVYQQTEGQRGFLSAQIDPRLYRSTELMVEHGRKLAQLAPNLAIKVPCTDAGIAAMEQLASDGILVNATVCFTVSQAITTAEALERGLAKAFVQTRPYISMMVGRLEDHLKRVAKADNLEISPQIIDWAGPAVFKKAYQHFKAQGFSSRLLVAAYRHEGHWTELVGENIVQTIPYAWWQKFSQSGSTLKETIHTPVDESIVQLLRENFVDFQKAYDEDGLSRPEFLQYPATVHTLDQFLTGYQRLVGLVRVVILNES